MKDLIVLVADKDIEFLLKGVLPRFPKVLNLKQFSFDIVVHPLHDPGCRTGSHDYLRPFASDYDYAMIIFDFEGCGAENYDLQRIEKSIEVKLNENGWSNRNSVVIINPEVENWVWVKSPYLAKAINWNSLSELENWLLENKLILENHTKPTDPKGAFEKALRKSKTPRSSSIYEEIAKNASFKQCSDIAFEKMKNQLFRWFRN